MGDHGLPLLNLLANLVTLSPQVHALNAKLSCTNRYAKAREKLLLFCSATASFIFDKETHRLIGAGITGIGAGELIAETVLAIEMGADAHDLGLTIHPHPTLSETVCFAAEVKEGTITDLYLKKR